MKEVKCEGLQATVVQRAAENNSKSVLLGCWDGAVVRALPSHQCGPGSIHRSDAKCGLSLLVLYSAPKGFLRDFRVPPSSKTKV